ncbi:MAG: alkaline phosphatase family protein [Gammaproteobacteria bacterium]|nr:alkaline phosphatase family protein [Gammaproteobacteria bacterium]
MHLPDYKNGSIVNLVSSIQVALGGQPSYGTLSQLTLSKPNTAGSIVLIVIDGLGHTYLKQRGRGVLYGHLVGRITSVFPSTTASAITSFFTGTAPQQHALTGWFTYFKELGAVAAPLLFRRRSSETSLTDAGVDARKLFDQPSMFERIDTPSHIVLPAHIVESEYTTAHSGPAERWAYTSLKQCFRVIEKIIRRTGSRQYIYAYWSEFDTLSHTFGTQSTEVTKHFDQLDAAFARFLDRIEGSGTTVVVTADHGFIDTGPDRLVQLESHPELASTLALPLCGEPRVAFCYVHPDRHERFEEYVQDRLGYCAEIYRSEQLVEQGFFGLGEPNPRLLDRIGHYALVMKGHYVIKDWIFGERRYEHVGVHGGVSEEEMYVPLIVVET